MKQVPDKASATSVQYNTEGSAQKLQQIQFGGSNQALVLSDGASTSTSGQ
jgi:hypothetical protein